MIRNNYGKGGIVILCDTIFDSSAYHLIELTTKVVN